MGLSIAEKSAQQEILSCVKLRESGYAADVDHSKTFPVRELARNNSLIRRPIVRIATHVATCATLLLCKKDNAAVTHSRPDREITTATVDMSGACCFFRSYF